MLFVDARGGAFDTRTDLIVINPADAATREVRRIGELHSVTIAPAAADAYAASSLVEGVALTDHTVGTVTAATAWPGGPGQRHHHPVCRADAPRRPARWRLRDRRHPIDRARHRAGLEPVTLTAPFATAAAAGEQIIAVRTLTADAPAGASFIAIDNRLGLSPGDVIRIGALPDDEYALVAAIPNPALAGVRPDAGTVLLASPLLLAHAPTTTPVVRAGHRSRSCRRSTRP